MATALGLAVVVAVVLWPAVSRGEVLFRRDVHLMWYAQMEALVRAVSRGEWPLWNADIGFGQPLWADANVQVLYPLTWLNLVMRPWTYYMLFAVVHLVFAGLGARALGRTLGLSRTAAAAAALLWVASGPLLSMAEIWNQLAGAAWMPWTLAAAVRTLRTGQRRWAVGWGAGSAAQVLAGSPEAFLLTLAGAAACAVALRPWREASPPWPRHALRGAALAAVLAASLSAGQWMPSLAAAAESNRGSLSAEERGYWSVHPLGAVQLLFPVAAGELPLRPEVASVLFGGDASLLPSLYLGLASVVLAAAAFAGGRPRAAAWLLAAWAGTLALALGRHLPLHAALAALPVVGALRYPMKAMMAVSLCWALLCGLGVDAWRDRSVSAGRWAAVVLGPAVVLAAAATAAVAALGLWPEAIGAALFPTGPAGELATRLAPARAELAAAATAAALVVVCAAARIRAGAARPLALAAVVLAVADLLAVHADLLPTAPVALFTHRPDVLDVARPPSHGRLYAYDYGVPGRSHLYLSRPTPFRLERVPEGWSIPAARALSMRLSLFPPSAAAWGIPGSFDHDTPEIAPRRGAVLFETLLRLEGSPAHARLLALGGVSRVATLHERGYEGLPLLATADTLLPEPLRVFEVPAARGRSYAVDRARVVGDDAAALALMLDPSFEADHVVVLADGADAPGGAAFRGHVKVEHIGADRVRLEAELGAPGFVVLNDAWAAGWIARVDGREVPVRRANVAWRAVEMGAGRHAVELRYWPAGLTAGLAATAASLLAAAALLVGRRGAPPARGPE
ncbi:MAG TPA: hypothetical protein VMR21_00230 [Vicinamibacteria bacterium]|nr:hypothetical protein [Vicinamibacteria bacterium]